MKFYLWNPNLKDWIRVSHKQARRRGTGRVIDYSSFGRLYFDKQSTGNWTKEKVQKYHPKTRNKN